MHSKLDGLRVDKCGTALHNIKLRRALPLALEAPRQEHSMKRRVLIGCAPN